MYTKKQFLAFLGYFSEQDLRDAKGFFLLKDELTGAIASSLEKEKSVMATPLFDNKGGDKEKKKPYSFSLSIDPLRLEKMARDHNLNASLVKRMNEDRLKGVSIKNICQETGLSKRKVTVVVEPSSQKLYSALQDMLDRKYSKEDIFNTLNLNMAAISAMIGVLKKAS
jgi:hypothetical protein